MLLLSKKTIAIFKVNGSIKAGLLYQKYLRRLYLVLYKIVSNEKRKGYCLHS